MEETSSSGKASQACKRCHTRKKRCSRTLPSCRGCVLSNEACSFQEQTGESGVFSVSYVRDLETRVQELERRLADSDRQAVVHSLGPSPASWPSSDNTRTGTFESELKDLSLQATAEAYLGQSSGLSFARLTQAVLKRLKPDHYPFAVDSNSTPTPKLPTSEIASHRGMLESGLITDEALDTDSLVDEDHAKYLADCYWSHSHTLYPFLQKAAFTENLQRMYTQPTAPDLRSRSWLYTMWMVLAIGSTARSSVMVSDESESVLYFTRASEHLDGALGSGALNALSAVLLQVSYSFFNKVGPNTWYLVGVGVRIALGVGLHVAPAQSADLPPGVEEHRRRLFFSLYMMDRLVSVSLGRPFGISDRDVEIDDFSSVDESFDMQTRSPLRSSAVAVPLHILQLRRICGRIFEQVYSKQNRHLVLQERDVCLQRLHQELIAWRRNMPFPLPQSTVLPVPHFSAAWYDLNYYQHVLMLYRPSPLFPVLTLEKVGIIADAASNFINQAANLQRERRYAFNWLNLFTVFTATVTLIYSITAQPEPLPSYLGRVNAIQDLHTVIKLLEIFALKFPSASKCSEMIEDIVQRLQSHINGDVSHRSSTGYRPTTSRAESGTQQPDVHHDPPAGLAYPAYRTGNKTFDDLQQQVRGLGSPTQRSGPTADLPSDTIPNNHPLFDFGQSANEFGSVAAQFLATGFGTSADMDLDSEMLGLINATSDAWSG